jgi:WD40 repeat protein
MKINKIDTFSGHRDCVYTLVATAESAQFFSAGGDGQIVLWDLSRPDVGSLVAQIPASVYAMAFDGVKNQLWVGQNYEGIQLIDPLKKTVIASSNITSSAIFDIQLFDNQAFVSQSDGVITVMDIENFAVKRHIKASNQSARCLAINKTKREIAIGYSDSLIRVFDIDDGNLKHTLTGHSNSVFTVQYSPCGQFLLSAGRDAHLRIWNIEPNYSAFKAIPAHLFAINHIVYSPDGHLFATCSMDKSIKIWEAATFKLLKVIDKARHAGHATSINKLWWSSYKQQLVSCSDDKKISVWEINIF